MTESPQDTPPITALLQKWHLGEQAAFDEVIQYVYNDLRRRAKAYIRAERDGQSLQPTGLVHEAFIKLVDKRAIDWQDRNHFFAIAAQAMRRILVDRVRTKRRDKRGGGQDDLPLDDAQTISAGRDTIDLLVLDEALTALAAFDERQARIVELKYFGGMTLEETAELLDISPATVKRDWQIARAWLRRQLEP
jgi:RNA polymerase sigma factor (TIGR02999 family)